MTTGTTGGHAPALTCALCRCPVTTRECERCKFDILVDFGVTDGQGSTVCFAEFTRAGVDLSIGCVLTAADSVGRATMGIVVDTRPDGTIFLYFDSPPDSATEDVIVDARDDGTVSLHSYTPPSIVEDIDPGRLLQMTGEIQRRAAALGAPGRPRAQRRS